MSIPRGTVPTTGLLEEFGHEGRRGGRLGDESSFRVTLGPGFRNLGGSFSRNLLITGHVYQVGGAAATVFGAVPHLRPLLWE